MMNIPYLEKYQQEVLKRWKLRKNTASTFLFFYLMVSFSVKDAYLIDIFSMEINNLVSLVKFTETFWKSVLTSDSIGIVIVDADIFLVNWSLLSQKLKSPETFPIKIDLNNSDRFTPKHLPPSEASVELDQIETLINGSKTLIDGKEVVLLQSNHPLFRQFGGPFLGGFLLGYPVVYWASLNEENTSYEIGSQLISYQSLQKYSFVISGVSSIVSSKNSDSSSLLLNILNSLGRSHRSVSLLEWTVPSSLLLENPGVTQFVTESVDLFLKRFQQMKEDRNSPSHPFLNDLVITYGEETIQAENISL
jgi:hypothetical protein